MVLTSYFWIISITTWKISILKRAEPYPLTKEDIEKLVKDSCMTCIGYIKVINYGGSYALVNKGIYVVYKQGHPEVVKKNRKILCSIILKLINRYLNFKHNGYSYSFNNGTWNRVKEKTV